MYSVYERIRQEQSSWGWVVFYLVVLGFAFATDAELWLLGVLLLGYLGWLLVADYDPEDPPHIIAENREYGILCYLGAGVCAIGLLVTVITRIFW